MLNWIGACVVLHNLLIITDVWEPTEEELQQVLQEELDRENENDNDEYEAEVQAIHTSRIEKRLPRIGQLEAEGHAKRQMLMNLINEKDVEEERRELSELAHQSNLLR